MQMSVRRYDTIALGLLKNKEKKKKKKKAKSRFLTSHGAYVKCTIMAMLYTHLIGNQLYNTMLMFKNA